MKKGSIRKTAFESYLDGLPVARISLNASSAFVDLPNFDLTVHSSGQDKMRRLGEPLDAGDALCVALPFVDLLLGQEALVRRNLGLEVGADVLRDVQERPVLVVVRVLDVKRRRLLDGFVLNLDKER